MFGISFTAFDANALKLIFTYRPANIYSILAVLLPSSLPAFLPSCHPEDAIDQKEVLKVLNYFSEDIY